MAEHREAADTRCSVDEAILMEHTSARKSILHPHFFLDTDYVSTIGRHFNIRMQPFTNTFKAPQVCFFLMLKHSFIPAGGRLGFLGFSR